MAEAAAVIGLVASIVNLIDFSNTVISRLREFTAKSSEVPKSFRALADRLPLLTHTLYTISTNARANRIENEVAADLQTLIDSIFREVSYLKDQLERILPRVGASKRERAWKGFKSVLREDKVTQAVEKVHKSIDVLVLHQTTGQSQTGDRILEELSKLSVASPSDPPPAFVTSLFTVPYPRDRLFISRKAIFDRIDKHELGGTVVLCGLGGTGKSQIAIEYAYRFRDRHPGICFVFWIYAGTTQSILQAFADIAHKLQLPGHNSPKVDACQLVTDWLEAVESRRWLLVIDNIDSPHVLDNPLRLAEDARRTSLDSHHKTLRDYLPKQRNANQILMMTTRTQDVVAALGEDDLVPVAALSPEESRTLFLNKLNQSVDHGFSDEKANSASVSDRLLQKLGYIPLAISQAAAFIKRNRLSVSHYLDILEKNDQHLADYLTVELQDARRPTGWPNSVFQTWKLSFEAIGRYDPIAIELLQTAALLDGQQIPKWLLSYKAQYTEMQITSAMGTLFGYALITQHAEQEMISVHPLVQGSVRFWLRQEQLLSSRVRHALCIVAENFEHNHYESQKRCPTLMPHAEKILSYPEVEGDSFQPSLLFYRAQYLWSCGLYAESSADANAAYTMWSKQLGEKSRSTLAALNLLGMVTVDQGKYEEAEAMHRKALTAYEEVLSPEHPDPLRCKNNLALVLGRQGKYAESEVIHRQALAGYKKALEPEHPDILTSMDNLAFVVSNQGRHEEAEELYREALKGYKKTLGEEHPRTLTNIDSFGATLRERGKYKEAEQAHRQALAGFEKVLGYDHPDTITAVWNLAFQLKLTGQYDESHDLFERALAGFEKRLGPDHPYTKICGDQFQELVKMQIM